jgi:hypothetical protein
MLDRDMVLRYNDTQRLEYLNMLDSVAQRWLRLFDDNTEFYSAVYWDLLTQLWKENRPIRRTDALRFMKSVKSATTASKYIDEAIQHGFLHERHNPQDARSKLITLSPTMRDHLDVFF